MWGSAIPTCLGSCRRRYDLELCSERVWVEIATAYDINYFIGNHYFSPDTKPNYFHLLENISDTKNICVIL
jgi:hypothetical protein